MQDTQFELAIVIPAYNEEAFIGDTLRAIKRRLTAVSYELVVVDNGSTDRTMGVVEAEGFKVVSRPEGRISALRNAGVKETSADVLVFIDADVEITDQWAGQIRGVLEELSQDAMQVTGSRYLPPDNRSWLNEHWYKPLVTIETGYINAGHLLTSRALFDRIDGFDEGLETGEDVDFCRRAEFAGARMVHRRRLAVIHHGYPATLRGFVLREKWLGRSMLGSKTGMLAMAHVVMIALAVVGAVTSGLFAAVSTYVVLVYLLCLVLSKYKFRALGMAQAARTAVVFYFYLIGRTLGLIDRMVNRGHRKRAR